MFGGQRDVLAERRADRPWHRALRAAGGDNDFLDTLPNLS